MVEIFRTFVASLLLPQIKIIPFDTPSNSVDYLTHYPTTLPPRAHGLIIDPQPSYSRPRRRRRNHHMIHVCAAICLNTSVAIGFGPVPVFMLIAFASAVPIAATV